ncbi:MAG: hypothetical protein HY854_12245 [Burkholderiales bacterium]|nr:hypothetical protein [Burkholderiales bacterium]
MSVSDNLARSTIALQLADAVDVYDSQLEQLVATHADPDQYQELGRQLDEMRMYASTVPQVSVCWVELLIRHFELLHGLWRVQQGRSDGPGIEHLRSEQRRAALTLRRKCLQVAHHDPAA